MIPSEIKARIMKLEIELASRKVEADALKLCCNSTFGKFNDAYSPLRSIFSALRVTINGQLELLMLIERLQLIGARILSANTDGVTFSMIRADFSKVEQQMKEWENDCGHGLELTEYTRYVRRDVNNYCAIKTDGKVKTKGAFELAPLSGKTDDRIVKIAAQKFLLEGKPIRETVRASKDIRDFIFYQRVKNGGTCWHGDYELGKTARWYVATKGEQIKRKNPDGTFDNLPDGGNAKLALSLPPVFPVDINYQYYIQSAKDLVSSVIYHPIPKRKKNAL